MRDMKKATVKLNCWEVKQCGREPGGKSKDLGVCPASVEKRLDGMHGGINAGRACWMVAGTLCFGKVQGTFAGKYDTCKRCDFFNLVKQEEGAEYLTSLFLLCKLK
jgi:hypothetical protein